MYAQILIEYFTWQKYHHLNIVSKFKV